MNKVAEGGVGNVDFAIRNSEGLEVFTSDLEDVSTSFRSSIWVKDSHLWVVIVPELKVLSRLLLSIE